MVPLEGYDEIEKRFEEWTTATVARNKKAGSRNKEIEARKSLPQWNRT